MYRPGEGVSAPKVIRKVEPRYTAEARRAAIQGTVVLEVTVDESGKPAAISILSPLGFGLDDRAREAVAMWRFQPGVKDGTPVRTVSTVEVNFRMFHRWFDPRAEEQRTSYNLVVDAIQGRRRTAATLETIKDLAHQKYPPAMYLYAKMLEAGDGFPQDRELAFRLIAEAAGRNHAAAIYETGRMAMEGRRVSKDAEKGLELVRNAAVLGHRQAQFFLGVAYESGDPVPRDADRARQYFRMCAARGETPCQVRLARLLLERPDRQERDHLQGIAWLEAAAEHGDAQAMLILKQEREGLTEKQLWWVDKLKTQIIRTQ